MTFIMRHIDICVLTSGHYGKMVVELVWNVHGSVDACVIGHLIFWTWEHLTFGIGEMYNYVGCIKSNRW